MSKAYGILLVSHVDSLAEGLVRLVQQIAPDVTVRRVAGAKDGTIGTDFDRLIETIDAFKENQILTFYDLGSAKMIIDLAISYSDKEIVRYDVAFVEGAYVAATLMQEDLDLAVIEKQLLKLVIRK